MPIRFKIWVSALICGLLAVCGFVLFLPPFPFYHPATATQWIPKLARNAACLPAYIGQVATDIYVVQYANMAFWLGLLGFGLGASISLANGQMTLLKRPGVVDKVQPVSPVKIGNSSTPTDRWNIARNRIVSATKLVWAFSVLFSLAFVLPWWTGFLGSACGWLNDGFPLYRAFQGLAPATMSGFLFFNIGCVFAIVFGLVTGRLSMFETVEDTSPSAGPDG
ncbi:hypothetical protein [Fuscibacter oryzae]|uniref:Uncharacterized protein n=1 Tax=Fuscibacter oryzae TaxID=2803939 RepID=A0A8J7MNC1_9RHOB|nr:hypothetical protein [Fuscibacter oryzae]MBL4926608.1 hypothetical protein [Fuscibacter oryzae]